MQHIDIMIKQQQSGAGPDHRPDPETLGARARAKV